MPRTRIRHRACLVSILLAGCAEPVGFGACVSLERSADFEGAFEHAMELEDGTRSEPAAIVWSRQEDYLYAFDAAEGIRLAFAVDSWLEYEEAPDAPCGLVAVNGTARPPTTRSHLRIDWSQELAGAGRELLGPDAEPVASFVGVDDATWRDRSPTRERDLDGWLRRLTIWTQYYVPAEDAVVAVRHELARVD